MSIQSEIDRLNATKKSIKNAIVAMGQSVSETDNFASYADKILEIDTTAAGTADATATAGDIVSGKTAYVQGAKVTGDIPVRTGADLTANGSTVTAPAGYYASQVSKDVAKVTQATPSVSVDSAGKITASAIQTAGYVVAGTKTGTKQLTTQGAKTVTPGTSEQTAVASGVYTTGAVKVAGDANLKAENIAEGVSIFGVAGRHVGEKKTVRVTVTVPVGSLYYYYANAEGVATHSPIQTGETHTIDAYGGAVFCYATRGATYTGRCTRLYISGADYFFVCLEDGCTITLTGTSGGGAD